MKRIITAISILLALSSCAVIPHNNDILYRAGRAVEPGEYVPQGKVVELNHPCTVPGPMTRGITVYLPKEYESGKEHYPVLYLLHGARGHQHSWIRKGDVFRLTDSLVNNGSCPPFILVLPNTNQYNNDRDCDSSRIKGAIESLFEISGAVETAFVNDVVDFTDAHFRTKAEKNGRAIAGLSIGALQSIYISAHNPSTFDYIGLFSPFYKVIPYTSDYDSFYKNLEYRQMVQFAVPPKLYMICIGKKDFFYPHIGCYRHYLDKEGYKYEYFENNGAHEWEDWKLFYCHFLTEVFR